MKYLSAGLVAGGAIERDLTAAALAMTGDQTESAARRGLDHNLRRQFRCGGPICR